MSKDTEKKSPVEQPRIVRLFSMRREMREAGISFRVQDDAKKEIQKLEAALEDCASALRVIHTWAIFRSGEMLNDRWSVAKLCKRVLDDLPNDERTCANS